MLAHGYRRQLRSVERDALRLRGFDERSIDRDAVGLRGSDERSIDRRSTTTGVPPLMLERANVHLRVASRPENVMLVREVLTGVADALALDPSDLIDINTAVTEACN
ncbi:MAG: hypothetical protein ABSH36_15665, partial [Solirubrobacteraceae bacterium]